MADDTIDRGLIRSEYFADIRAVLVQPEDQIMAEIILTEGDDNYDVTTTASNVVRGLNGNDNIIVNYLEPGPGAD